MSRMPRAAAGRAPRAGALLRWATVLAALALAAAQAAAAAPACAPDRIDARVRVGYVFDGDTFEIEGGRRVRLIGVNTPELGRDGRPPEPLALAARERLIALIARAGRTVGLRYGREREDRYGRLLAHAFLPDGTDVAAVLIREGLGFAIAVPPNLWGLECRLAAERAARARGLGVWRHRDFFGPLASARLRPGGGVRGFRIVEGRVVRIGRSRRSIWLNLEGRTALRVAREDLPLFRRAGIDPERLAGRRVRARGWIFPRHGELQMRVRHPSALAVLP